MSIELSDYQLDAVSRMKNGCILCGGVGSGKSRTALAYYFTQEDIMRVKRNSSLSVVAKIKIIKQMKKQMKGGR